MRMLIRNAMMVIALSATGCGAGGGEAGPTADGAIGDVGPEIECPPVGTEDPAPKFGGAFDAVDPEVVDQWGIQVRHEPAQECTLSNDECVTLSPEERWAVLNSRVTYCRTCPLQAAVELGATIIHLDRMDPMFAIEAPGHLVVQLATRSDIGGVFHWATPVVPE